MLSFKPGMRPQVLSPIVHRNEQMIFSQTLQTEISPFVSNPISHRLSIQVENGYASSQNKVFHCDKQRISPMINDSLFQTAREDYFATLANGSVEDSLFQSIDFKTARNNDSVEIMASISELLVNDNLFGG